MNNEYREPPQIDPSKIDFSRYHPLDHWPWQCGDLYGGWRNHVSMTWDIRRKPALRAATVCRFGVHRRCQMWRRNPETEMTWTQVVCQDCGKPLSNPQPV